MFEEIVKFIRSLYPGKDVIPLHEPVFAGREKEYVSAAIDSTFVSSVGEYVDRFEKMICEITGAKYAVATVNGTAALHMALLLAGVKPGEEVIIQPLTFVATANAISYCGAEPIFVDVDKTTLGLSPDSLQVFLKDNTTNNTNGCINKVTKKRISACVPMHTFGHPCRIDDISEICVKHEIALVEDAAESLGSTYKGRHTGTFGRLGILSFNGNKTVTCGGGGVIVTDDIELAERGKHLTTTAKVDHPWEYIHNDIGYNYRLPNLNAALACAQLEQLDLFLRKKRELAGEYKKFFENMLQMFIDEPLHSKSNFWLNVVTFENRKSRDGFLRYSNESGVHTRPAWQLMNSLDSFKHCQTHDLKNANWLQNRIVNLPSSVRL